MEKVVEAIIEIALLIVLMPLILMALIYGGVHYLIYDSTGYEL